MKLIKIKDIRKGQIYKGIKNYYLISSDIMVFDDVNGCCYHCSEFGLDNEYTGVVLHIHKNDIKQFELIGFLDITHKVIGNKLIEIPREELEKDDIIEIDMKKYAILKLEHYYIKSNYKKETYGDFICLLDRDGNYSNDVFEPERMKYINKIGTLNFNYEFINDKLNENE